MAKEDDSPNDVVVHEEALKRFEHIQDAERDQRSLAIEDMNFAHAEDGQWDDDAKKRRTDRPRYTINRVAPAIDQITGDQLQNRTQIKVRPVSGGSKEVAKIEQGLIRNIEANSDAESIYDIAFLEMATGGRGGWRVLTEFNDDDSFEQDIVLESIESAASSLYIDHTARKPNKSDAMWGFYVEDMDQEKFKEKWPDAAIADFTTDNDIYWRNYCSTWYEDNTVKVAEYWRVDMKDVEIALMSDGTVINLTEEEPALDELAEKGITVLKKRPAKIRKVESYLMSGAEILKGPMPWAGKYIPLIEVLGRTVRIQGKQYARGMVRFAKDPQRIYNYATSNAIETTALSPKDPIWITGVQAAGHKKELETFNTKNSPFMQYNADPDAPGPPQRGGAPQVQQALIVQQQQSADDLQATTGLFAPAMGNAPQLLSEKSVIAQADKGDRGSYVFTSSLHKGISYTGTILLDLMPRIIDTERVVRVLNFDGTSEEVTVNGIGEFNNQVIDSETGDQVLVNDLSRGKYEAVVEAGPAFSTRRQESASQLIELATGSPQFGEIAFDLIAKSLDIVDSEEITKRARKVQIQKGIAEPTEDEIKEFKLDQPAPPDPEAEALLENVRVQTGEGIARTEKINAETDALDIKSLGSMMDANKTALDGLKTLIETFVEQQKAGIPLGQPEHQLKVAQQGIAGLTQEEVVKDAVEQRIEEEQEQQAVEQQPQQQAIPAEQVPRETPIA